MMGADNLIKFHKWDQWQDIVKIAKILMNLVGINIIGQDPNKFLIKFCKKTRFNWGEIVLSKLLNFK